MKLWYGQFDISEDDVQDNLSDNGRRMDTDQTNTKAIVASGIQLKEEEIVEAPQPDPTASRSKNSITKTAS